MNGIMGYRKPEVVDEWDNDGSMRGKKCCRLI